MLQWLVRGDETPKRMKPEKKRSRMAVIKILDQRAGVPWPPPLKRIGHCRSNTQTCNESLVLASTPYSTIAIVRPSLQTPGTRRPPPRPWHRYRYPLFHREVDRYPAVEAKLGCARTTCPPTSPLPRSLSPSSLHTSEYYSVLLLSVIPLLVILSASSFDTGPPSDKYRRVVSDPTPSEPFQCASFRHNASVMGTEF
jgi:hypothetical protein